MFNMGGGELALVAIVTLLLVPSHKLPEVATTLGKFLNQLQSGFNEVKNHMNRSIREELPKLQKKSEPPPRHDPD